MIGDAVTIKANSIAKANCKRIMAVVSKFDLVDQQGSNMTSQYKEKSCERSRYQALEEGLGRDCGVWKEI